MATNSAINSSLGIQVAFGGTGLVNPTTNRVLIGNGTSALALSNAGTNGQAFIGSNSSNPAFATLTSSFKTLAYTTGAASLNIDVGPTKFLNTLNAESNMTSTQKIGTKTATTSIINVGSNMTTGNGAGTAATFTAPITGSYQIDAEIEWTVTTGQATTIALEIISTARNYFFSILPTSLKVTNFAGPSGNISGYVSTVVAMSAGDTVTWGFSNGGGNGQASITGGYISGGLIL